MKKFLLNTLIYVVIIAGGILAVFALKTPKTQPLSVSLTKGVKIVKLKNGATIILKNIPSSEVSSVQTFIKTGSINEGKYLGYGLSHCIEHMLFKGTDKYKVGEVSRAIRNAGGQLNAYTSFERTVFHITVPSENTKKVMSIMANVVLHSSFNAKELQKEKKVIMREMAMDNDDPDRAVGDFFFDQAFSRLPYHYPVIGYKRLFETISRSDVVHYYHRRYKPENLTFVCVGQFQQDDIVKAIKKEFENYKYYPMANTIIPTEPEQIEYQYAEKKSLNVKLSRLILGWKTVPLRHPDLYALDVLANLLGRSKASILYEIFQEKLNLVDSITAMSYTPGYTGVFTIEVKLKDKNIKAFTNQLFSVMNRLPSYITEKKLTIVKNQVLRDYVNRLQTVQGQAAELGGNYISAGNIDFGKKYVEGLQSVTKKDILTVYQKYFHHDSLTEVALRPISKTTNKEKSTSIVQQTKPEKVILKNGLRILYVPKSNLPLVTMKFLVKGGTLLNTKPGLGNFVSKMIARNTVKYKKLKAYSVLEAKGGSLSVYSANNSAGATVSILDTHVDKALDVLAQVVMKARFPKKDIEKVRKDLISEIKSQNEEIFNEGGNLLRKTMYSNHPYGYNALGTVESVSQITKKDLLAFYNKYYIGKQSVLVVVGKITPKLKQKIERKFAKLSEGNGELPLYAKTSVLKSKRIFKTIPKEQSLVLLAYPLSSITNQDRYSIEVLSRVLSGLGSRLFTSLRDTQHLCYYVGGYPNFALKQGFFLYYIGTEASKMLQAEKGLFKEVQKIRTSPIIAEELKRARNDLIGKYKSESQSYDSLALSIGLAELYYNNYQEYYNYIQKINSVTIQDVYKTASHIFANSHTEVLLKGEVDE